jgi:hypothetical protein
MDFIDKIRALNATAQRQLPNLQTEEATKHALVLPFLAALGYDVFDPTEVVPEFTTDVGTKKGEKVDYAIFRDGAPVILIECKWSGADLDTEHASQLFRYFTVTNARFAILTNGLLYRFYTDLDEANKMDQKPFLEFNLLDIREPLVDELRKFAKSTFDLDTILATASELKYTKEVRRILNEEFQSPSQEFVRFLVARVYSGNKTQAVIAQFTDVVRRAVNQLVSDRISDRLKQALADESSDLPLRGDSEPTAAETPPPSTRDVVTTPEEWEAFYIVKAILRQRVDQSRICLRDALSYCSVILDDTNRKPICRFKFTDRRKQLVVFGPNKVEQWYDITGLDDIYAHADEILGALAIYGIGPAQG